MKINTLVVLILSNILILSSCANNETTQQEAMMQGEFENKRYTTSDRFTIGDSLAAIKQSMIDKQQNEFEDELYLDSVQFALEDSLLEQAMQQPIVVNRAAVMKKLKPNKDDIVMIDWNMLNDIKLNECFNETIGEYYWCPEFGEIMKSLEGKTVALKGYVLPLDGGYFVLSMNPMASCFFCGGSGPQSIVDLKFNSPRAFKMDTYKTFKGKLRLNSDNIEELFYVLDDADLYKAKN